MKILTLIIFLVISAFADYRVIQEYKVNNGKVTTDYVYDYKVQSVCKDSHRYTVVFHSNGIGITQDFIKSPYNSDVFPVKCENEKWFKTNDSCWRFSRRTRNKRKLLF